jgi:hypothetical protein
LNRREFLKTCGKAGLAAGAGGLLSSVGHPDLSGLSARAFAEGEAAGGPLLVKLHGTPRDMGKQYAEQAGDLIRARLKLLREKGSKIPQENVEMAKIFLNVTANSILLEIEAMAEGLNEKEDDLLTLSAETPGVGMRTGGCSSFIIDKSIAQDGKVWMGQNVDDSQELEKFGVVIIRHPLEQPPMIVWALAGGIGGVGMNITGQAILMNYMQTAQRKPPNAIFPEWIANCALRQKEFKDFSAVLTQTQIMCPCTFLAADKDNTRLVIERTSLLFNAFSPAKYFAAYTNHFVDEQMRTEDTTAKVFPDSKARLKRLEALLAAREKKKDITPDYLKKALSDVEGEPTGICRHANPPTIASVIMCPKDGVMMVTRGGPDREKYHEFVLTQKE